MHVLYLIVTPFNLEIENADIESHLEYELNMCVDLQATSLFRSKNISNYWSNVNTATKYLKPSAVVELCVLAFPIVYMVETSFSHANAVLTKQRNRLSLKESGDSWLKLTNLQPIINALCSSNTTVPSTMSTISIKRYINLYLVYLLSGAK